MTAIILCWWERQAKTERDQEIETHRENEHYYPSFAAVILQRQLNNKVSYSCLFLTLLRVGERWLSLVNAGQLPLTLAPRAPALMCTNPRIDTYTFYFLFEAYCEGIYNRGLPASWFWGLRPGLLYSQLFKCICPETAVYIWLHVATIPSPYIPCRWRTVSSYKNKIFWELWMGTLEMSFNVWERDLQPRGVFFLTLYFACLDFSHYWGDSRRILLVVVSHFLELTAKARLVGQKAPGICMSLPPQQGIQAHHSFRHFPLDSRDHLQIFMPAEQSFYRLGSISCQCMTFLRLFLPHVCPGFWEATILFGLNPKVQSSPRTNIYLFQFLRLQG